MEKQKSQHNIYAVLGTVNFKITDEELFDKVINALITRYKNIYLKRFNKFVPITKELILERNRESAQIYLRQLLCHFLRTKRLKLQKIGKLIQQDHTTVINAVNSFQNRLDTHSRIPITIQTDSKNTFEDYSYFKRLV